MKKIINFIKYHNAAAIVISLILTSTISAFAASPEVRDAFVSSQETVKSVDNSYLLSANLDNFNFGLTITGITENQDNYYITYFYKTIYIKDYVWQDIEKEKIFDVSKEFLTNKDLGLYAAEQLGEVIDHELSYLKEVQTLEREKGLTQKISTTQYAGLIGKFLSPEEKVFPGYQPVVLETEPQPQIVQESVPPEDQIIIDNRPESNPNPPIAVGSIDKKALSKIIQDLLAQGGQAVSVPESVQTAEQPTEQPAENPESTQEQQNPIEQPEATEQSNEQSTETLPAEQVEPSFVPDGTSEDTQPPAEQPPTTQENTDVIVEQASE